MIPLGSKLAPPRGSQVGTIVTKKVEFIKGGNDSGERPRAIMALLSHNVFKPIEENFFSWITFNLESANAFKLDQFKVLLLRSFSMELLHLGVFFSVIQEKNDLQQRNFNMSLLNKSNTCKYCQCFMKNTNIAILMFLPHKSMNLTLEKAGLTLSQRTKVDSSKLSVCR